MDSNKHTTLPATMLLTARVRAAELITQGSYSYIQPPTHCSSAEHWAPNNQNKKKETENTFPAQAAYTNESLNILPP
jgi:hypothetical protein